MAVTGAGAAVTGVVDLAAAAGVVVVSVDLAAAAAAAAEPAADGKLVVYEGASRNMEY